MAMIDIAQTTYDHGQKWPYDAPDAWWAADGESPPPADDWAHAAARGLLSDLNDRRGIKNGFRGVEEETRAEIVQSLARIIRHAHARTKGDAA